MEEILYCGKHFILAKSLKYQILVQTDSCSKNCPIDLFRSCSCTPLSASPDDTATKHSLPKLSFLFLLLELNRASVAFHGMYELPRSFIRDIARYDGMN